MDLSIEQVRQLLEAMVTHNKPAIVDWTNHRIMVLSDVKPFMRNGKQVQLSDGPATCQDYLFHIP